MVRLTHTIAATLTLLLAGRVAGWEKRRDAHGKTIIAYYASWQWYDRSGLAKPSNLDHSLVTRYTFAFFQINERGDIWGTDAWGDPNVLFGEYDWNWVPGSANTYCSWDGPGEPPTCAGHKYHTGLISQAHAAGVEIYPSIGGWTLSDPFSKLAENPAARTKFAENCVKLIEDYDFDGIDIDWEVRTPVLFYELSPCADHLSPRLTVSRLRSSQWPRRRYGELLAVSQGDSRQVGRTWYQDRPFLRAHRCFAMRSRFDQEHSD